MLYLDTSVIVAFLAAEPHTARVQSWMRRHEAETFAISDWLMTEFSAALSRKIREGDVDEEKRADVSRRLKALIARNMVRFPVPAAGFERGAQLAGSAPGTLRGGDALHLAIADLNKARLCTLDKRFASACKALNCDAELV